MASVGYGHDYSSMRTRVISVTSGKGGVGKTSLVANLALQLGREGNRVLILDGDFGMANVDIMFNVRHGRGASATVADVLSGNAAIKNILLDIAQNVTLIPGGSGIFELQNLTVFERQLLLDQVGSLGADYDFMLIDTAPGIDDNVLYLNSAAQEICVVITPEPSSFADGYALIKVLNHRHRENRFSVICNEVRDEADGKRLFEKLNEVAQRFLYVRLDYKGSVPNDPILRQATRAQQLVIQSNPDANSSHAIRKMAQKFRGYGAVEECKGSLQFFWEQLVGVA
jgi:flagellar biosynthesis protein FlhG